jgi:hypothetical protein
MVLVNGQAWASKCLAYDLIADLNDSDRADLFHCWVGAFLFQPSLAYVYEASCCRVHT